jgi:PIN domain nuclease of toxin-antitoxin system
LSKVLIDTTYLLPAAGIRVEGVPPDATRRIKDAGHQVLVSEISLLEILAKGAKLASEGRADPSRVSLAIKSILSDGSIEKVGAYDNDDEGGAMTMLAIELRRHHSDFLDCLILASAASRSDALLTEDAGMAKNDDLMKAVLSRKPTFRVLTLRALLAGQ